MNTYMHASYTCATARIFPYLATSTSALQLGLEAVQSLQHEGAQTSEPRQSELWRSSAVGSVHAHVLIAFLVVPVSN